MVTRGKQAGSRKDLKGASEYFEAAYKVSRSFSKKDVLRRDSAYYLAYAKFIEEDKTRAAALFQEFLDHPLISEADGIKVASALSLIGTIHYGSDNAKAAEYFEKALEIQRRLGLSTFENETMLGTIKTLEHKHAEAIPHYEAAFDKQKHRDVDSAQNLSVQLAYAHKELGDKDGEMQWQKANLKMREKKTAFTTEKQPITINTEVPDGWAKDGLSHFLEGSRQNELATFFQRRAEYEQLKKINDRFLDNRTNLILTMMPTINERYKDINFENIELEPEEWLEAFFYLRTHASFAGAARLALSAQLPEMYMLLRGCIENAIYGIYVWKKPELKSVWLNRNASEADKQAMKDQFTINKIKKVLSLVNENLGDEIIQMYEETIDQGAHPNVKAFVDHAVQKNEDGALSLAVSILNPGQLDSALTNVAKTGVLVLRVFETMYPKLID